MKQTLFGMALLMCITACAPLEQAPLVYSSKVALGVDLSATMTEAPGASITVGYKQVDAAYVPVAVAKPCTGTDTACAAPAYQLMPLWGANTMDSGDEDTEANQANAKKLLDDVQKASSVLAERRSAEQLAFQSVQVANESLNRLKTELASPKNPPLSLDQEARAKALIESDIPNAQDKAKQAAEALARAQEATVWAKAMVDSFNVDQLAKATKIIRGSDKKSDAYSVFGSFDGATRAAVTAGGATQAKGETALIVGKVFSTGIASQFLTQGMRDYYANMAAERVASKVVDCLTAALLHKDPCGRSNPNPRRT